jgi:hypothetical protein
MAGYIYITGTNTDPGAKQNLNDPVFAPRPSLGACMPNMRRVVSLGDYIFVVSGSTRGVQQYVVGGFKVEEKISALAAYRRFPENRLRIDGDGRLQGNIIVDNRGKQHELDRHDPGTFTTRIEDFIVGADPVVLATPGQIARGRSETLEQLAAIMQKKRANRVIDIMGRWAKLNESQVRQTLDWLGGITASTP